MSPLEVATRAVCADLGADPATWRGFAAVAIVGLTAFADALPPEVAEIVRPFIPQEVS